MPAVSKAQANLMRAAEHGADFPLAKKLRKSMTPNQLHEFTHGPEQEESEPVLKGDSKDVMHVNAQTFRHRGLSEADAVKKSIGVAQKHPNRPNNLGTFLHKRKDDK